MCINARGVCGMRLVRVLFVIFCISRASAQTCAAGTYSTSTDTSACVSCPAGTYSGVSGASSAGACVSCPVNTTSPGGSSSVSNCTCTAGTYASSTANLVAWYKLNGNFDMVEYQVKDDDHKGKYRAIEVTGGRKEEGSRSRSRSRQSDTGVPGQGHAITDPMGLTCGRIEVAIAVAVVVTVTVAVAVVVEVEALVEGAAAAAAVVEDSTAMIVEVEVEVEVATGEVVGAGSLAGAPGQGQPVGEVDAVGRVRDPTTDVESRILCFYHSSLLSMSASRPKVAVVVQDIG